MLRSPVGVLAALLSLLLLLAPGGASAAPRFESWTPLGAYERAALREGAAFRMLVPTRDRTVELSLQPSRVAGHRYHAERLSGRGPRAGVGRPSVGTWSGEFDGAPGDFARLSWEPAEQRVSGLLRVEGTLYELGARLARGDLVLEVGEITAEELAALLEGCGLPLEMALEQPLEGDSEGGAAGEPLASGSGSPLEIELGTEADAPFVSQMGGVDAANARILALVNLVNGLYETDLGLTNRVVVQRAWTGSDPYTSSESSTLLNEFQVEFSQNVSTSHDDAQLFSGREFDSNVIGRAFVGTVCTNRPYGVNQALGFGDALLSLIVAHEEGHTLGGFHVTDGVMAPSLGGTGSAYFSTESQDQIASLLATVSCLDPAPSGGPPTLDPVGPRSVGEAELLEIQLAASDPDGAPLTFAASPLLPGATIDADGLFRYTAPFDTVGCDATTELLVELSVSDGSFTTSEVVPISVSDFPTGAAPALSDPADRSVDVAQPLSIQLDASDADGDTLVFGALGMPEGATLSASGAFSWAPSAAQVGMTTIVFSATDCTGRSASQDVVIDVSETLPPQLDSLSPDSGPHRSAVTISGRDLLGQVVEVWFGTKQANVREVGASEIRVSTPKAPKGVSQVDVRVVRDGTPSDNSLTFTYAEGSGGGGGGGGKGGGKGGGPKPR